MHAPVDCLGRHAEAVFTVNHTGCQCLGDVENARCRHEAFEHVEGRFGASGALGDDAGVKLQIVVQAHGVFGHARVIHGAVDRPVKGMKQELAMRAGRACFAGKKDDVAHGFDGAEVVRLHGHRERDEEVVEREAVAALPTHGGDLQHQLIGALMDGLAAFVDQLTASVGVDRCGEMHDVGSHDGLLCNEMPLRGLLLQ